MALNSLSFLFLLLPLTAVAYFVWNNRRWRNGVLLISSLLFYAWAEPKFILLLLAAALVAWLGGLAVAASAGARKRAICILTLCLLTANLFCFKYLGFAAENLGALLGRNLTLTRLVLPAGISFYTFQLLSYVIDVSRGTVPAERNFAHLALFTCFFPQLIVGPILRYGDFAPQITDRRETAEDIAAGARRFILGLAKKTLLASGTAELAQLIYGGDPALYGSTLYWIAAVAYALEIYFDFSGYSDMAIGLGRIFGFRLAENFDYPYTALSITDFWRRWHMSLSSWFRDYIYIPLGGNRAGKARWMLNLLIVWALTGFWHGAQWNFLFWGLYYGVLLMLEKLLLGRVLDKLPRLVRWLYTALIVTVGWVLFNLTDFAALAAALRQMFAFVPTDWADAVLKNTDLLYGVVYLPLGIVCMLPLRRYAERFDSTAALLVKNLGSLALLLMCIAFLIGGSFNPFIYFRF